MPIMRKTTIIRRNLRNALRILRSRQIRDILIPRDVKELVVLGVVYCPRRSPSCIGTSNLIKRQEEVAFDSSCLLVGGGAQGRKGKDGCVRTGMLWGTDELHSLFKTNAAAKFWASSQWDQPTSELHTPPYNPPSLLETSPSSHPLSPHHGPRGSPYSLSLKFGGGIVKYAGTVIPFPCSSDTRVVPPLPGSDPQMDYANEELVRSSTSTFVPASKIKAPDFQQVILGPMRFRRERLRGTKIEGASLAIPSAAVGSTAIVAYPSFAPRLGRRPSASTYRTNLLAAIFDYGDNDPMTVIGDPSALPFLYANVIPRALARVRSIK